MFRAMRRGWTRANLKSGDNMRVSLPSDAQGDGLAWKLAETRRYFTENMRVHIPSYAQGNGLALNQATIKSHHVEHDRITVDVWGWSIPFGRIQCRDVDFKFEDITETERSRFCIQRTMINEVGKLQASETSIIGRPEKFTCRSEKFDWKTEWENCRKEIIRVNTLYIHVFTRKTEKP